MPDLHFRMQLLSKRLFAGDQEVWYRFHSAVLRPCGGQGPIFSQVGGAEGSLGDVGISLLCGTMHASFHSPITRQKVEK